MSASAATPAWVERLGTEMARLEARAPGHLGIYVKDLGSGADFSLRAEERWYLASGVKLPVALELLRREESGELSLDETITVAEDDRVDGAGATNHQPPGSQLSLRFLLEQMMIESDNTASDLLIRRVGVDAVNARVKQLAPEGFCEITTLADVRRHAYGAAHPAASRLRGEDLLKIKAAGEGDKRIRRLASVLQVAPSEMRTSSLDEAFRSYYESGLNSATLVAYARLLEALADHSALSPARSALLLGIMTRARTGQARIRAGLPSSLTWAHKTGTQHARVCDFGLAWRPSAPGRKLLVAACVRGLTLPQAERLLKDSGAALATAGIFSP